MTDFKFYVPITKIDEEKRLVYGRATQEIVDKSGEIFDYESSKPYFEAWSAQCAKDSEALGLPTSYGNIRAMHGKSVAGKIAEKITFNDEEKAIDIVSKVVNDNEWKMVQEGCYLGYSIGGGYVNKWKDEELNATRYTADPNEISLVDSPCCQAAKFFDVVKANGVVEQRAFKEPEMLNKYAGEEIQDSAQAIYALQMVMSLLCTETQEAADPSNNEPSDQVTALAAAVKQLKAFVASEIMEDNSDDMQMAEKTKDLAKVVLAKIAAREDVNPKEGKDKYGDVDFADEKNKKYPIDTEEHIRAAWNYINKEKNGAKYEAKDLATIKSKIVSAWKKKIDPAGPPSVQEKAMTNEDLQKAGAKFSAASKADLDQKHQDCMDAHAALGKCLKSFKGAWDDGTMEGKDGTEGPDGKDGKDEADKSVQNDGLVKMTSDLQKANLTIETLQKRITELENQPEPSKAFRTGAAVEKADDVSLNPDKPNTEDDLSKMNPQDRALAMIKNVLRGK